MRLRTLALVPLFLASSSYAYAATKTAGPGKTYPDPCAAIAAADPGDVIEVDAGTYTVTCSWSTDNLTIRGVNGKAKLDRTGMSVSGDKAIFVTDAPNVTFENLEFTGARLPPSSGKNGAGIRHQGTNLTVRGCSFHDNDDGILGQPPAHDTGDVLIETSEFFKNGYGDGQSHNMYLNDYATFTLLRSYTHQAVIGHLIKSRASKNVIAYNRITDEDGTASYEIDLPEAGLSYVIGNIIQQSATTDNPNVVAYGEETAKGDKHLFLVNNTFVNDKGSGNFVFNATSTPTTIVNNIFVGAGTITTQNGAVLTTNHTDADGDPMLVARATYDYRLQAGSPAIDKGTSPFTNGADDLLPNEEYTAPLAAGTRKVVGSTIDIGAFEFGNVPNELPDGGASSSSSSSSSGSSGVTGVPDSTSSSSGGSSGGSNGGSSSGCGCSTPGHTTRSAGALALVAIALLARRRRNA